MSFNFNVNPDEVWPRPESIESLIKIETDKVNLITEKSILSGFDYQFTDGKVYHFDFRENDQLNFMMKLADAQAALATQVQSNSVIKEIKQDYDPNNSEAALNTASASNNAYWCVWQAKRDGKNYTLPFTIEQFIELANKAGKIKEEKLAKGWAIKDKLRQCTNKKELTKMTEDLNLEQQYAIARDN